MRAVPVLAFAVMWFFLGIVPGQADRRVALVIGNGAYQSVPKLPNPPNDADSITAALKRLGFMVTEITNANFDDMRRSLIDFGRQVLGADMAVVFFAGHGMEIGGENWLIPVDAELRSDTDAENEAVSLKSVMWQVAKANQLGLVILDSCRNNPFAAKMQRRITNRAYEPGLARVEPTDNVLVAYAAKDGTMAIDGNGRNSPFTTALLANIEKPGLEIQFMLRNVRDDVMAATGRAQQPFWYGSLSREAIYLNGPPSASDIVPSTSNPVVKPAAPASAPDVASVPARPVNGPDSAPTCNEAAQAWQDIKTTSSIEALTIFKLRYPNCVQAIFAQARIDDLKLAPHLPVQPVVVVPPAHTPTPTPVQPAVVAPPTTFLSGIGTVSRWAKGGACGDRRSAYSLTVGGSSVTWRSDLGNTDIESIVSSEENEFRTRTTSSPTVKVGQIWTYTKTGPNQMLITEAGRGTFDLVRCR
jgi:hypothetical protein